VIQPRPLSTHVSYFYGVTAIARRWGRGDTERCRLCERCEAGSEMCLIQVNGFVQDEDAPLFSMRRGLRLHTQDP
jgi:hypothetical protein